MGSPSTSLATLRPDLMDSFEQFDTLMDRQGFIGQRVLPIIDVQVAAGTFGKIPLEQLLKNRDTLRASRAGYNRGDWTFEEDSFATKEYGFEEPVDERDAKLYANYFNAEQVSAEAALDAVLRAAEIRVANAVFNATTWTGAALTTAVANEWDDFVNATPISDVLAAKNKVFDGCGLWPNAMIIDRKVATNLRRCTEVIESIHSSGAGDSVLQGRISTQQLAEAFDLEEIIVAGGAQNTATEGQSRVISTLWSGEYAMVCRVARTNNIKEPCIGRILHWGLDGSVIAGAMETYRDEKVRSDVVRARQEVQEKILYAQAGHLLSNITT